MDARPGREQQNVVEGQGQRQGVVRAPGSFDWHQAPAPDCTTPWHFLNFLPDPQGQGSLRPTFGLARWIVSTFASAPPSAAAP